MANAVGIEVGDRETRDIADIFALTEPEYLEMTYCDPNAGRRDFKSLPPAEAVPRHAPAKPPRDLRGAHISTIRG